MVEGLHHDVWGGVHRPLGAGFLQCRHLDRLGLCDPERRLICAYALNPRHWLIDDVVYRSDLEVLFGGVYNPKRGVAAADVAVVFVPDDVGETLSRERSAIGEAGAIARRGAALSRAGSLFRAYIEAQWTNGNARRARARRALSNKGAVCRLFRGRRGPAAVPRGAALHRISASGPSRNDGVE